MRAALLAAVLPAFAALVFLAALLLHVVDDGICRHCRHDRYGHGHLRSGTDCSAKHCTCPRYRTREVRHVLADRAAAVLDAALGWVADIASALIGAGEQAEADRRRTR